MPVYRREGEKQVVIAVVKEIGWAGYSVLPIDLAKDFDRPGYTQVYLYFKYLPIHSFGLFQGATADEAEPRVFWEARGNGIDFFME